MVLNEKGDKGAEECVRRIEELRKEKRREFDAFE